MSETWDSWTDVIGNEYRPGDLVCIATISGRSPQLVIAEVVKINKTDKNGEPFTTRQWFDHDEPIMKRREVRRYNYQTRTYDDIVEEYVEKGEYRQVPSCTVTCQPIQDTRKFYRSTNSEGKARKVTYTIIENIIKVADRELS